MGGINASKENHEMISKQIRLFENRLDKALVKFNGSLAKNKQLREQIDNLRKERGELAAARDRMPLPDGPTPSV